MTDNQYGCHHYSLHGLPLTTNMAALYNCYSSFPMFLKDDRQPIWTPLYCENITRINDNKYGCHYYTVHKLSPDFPMFVTTNMAASITLYRASHPVINTPI
ncbi:hypothetical protein GDO81_016576 [Engystomops pustulosus]|uniref:Uncharacterized protein n=1 Tax=Engystomops pustulosus TaxID=76066 RepID=A0AAV7B0V6_ENGPU|nr:hypothetical protein GDO81_016576 [Engystomops pustulosus]